MDFDRLKPLRATLQGESFSRQQLAELLGDVIGRICLLKDPEIEAVQHDLSEAHEQLRNDLGAVEERLARRSNEVDEMDLARIKRACGSA